MQVKQPTFDQWIDWILLTLGFYALSLMTYVHYGYWRLTLSMTKQYSWFQITEGTHRALLFVVIFDLLFMPVFAVCLIRRKIRVLGFCCVGAAVVLGASILNAVLSQVVNVIGLP